ncbi:hypothetical protein QTI66_36550 [Variovorax sp. J22R133]|nr:hypothetical protein [Variovorax sp. J22R133]MDM0117624.1 hypothetical protein [Variovorax sp. J22R133]
MSLDFDVAWLSLVPEHDQLQRFMRDLLASIASVDPAIAAEAGLLTEGVGSDAETERWIIVLVQAIAPRQRDLVVMLDVLQHIQDPRIFQAVQWLLDYAPGRLHLALSSRSALPLSFESMRSKSLVTELDMRDLRFSPDESERYLREQLGSIDRSDALALHDLSEGWVAGLQLFALDLRTKEGSSSRSRYAPVRVRDAQAFASYFEREVLVRLAAEDLDMLTRASVSRRFCVPLRFAAGRGAAIAARACKAREAGRGQLLHRPDRKRRARALVPAAPAAARDPACAGADLARRGTLRPSRCCLPMVWCPRRRG